MSINKEELKEMVENNLFGDEEFSLDDLGGKSSDSKGKDPNIEKILDFSLDIEPESMDLSDLNSDKPKTENISNQEESMDDLMSNFDEKIPEISKQEDNYNIIDAESDLTNLSDLNSDKPKTGNLSNQEESIIESDISNNKKSLLENTYQDQSCLQSSETNSTQNDFSSKQQGVSNKIETIIENKVNSTLNPALDKFTDKTEKQIKKLKETIKLNEKLTEKEIMTKLGHLENMIKEAKPNANLNQEKGSNTEEIPEELHANKLELPEFQETNTGSKFDMSFFSDIPINVDVFLGKSELSLKDIYELSEGSIIELDKLIGEPLELRVNNQQVALGEVVTIDNNYGILIKKIVT